MQAAAEALAEFDVRARGTGGLGAPHPRGDARLRARGGRPRPAGHHRRRRRGGPPARHGRQRHPAAGHRRAGAAEATWTAWTRCCRSCRCRPASRWPRCRSAAPATPACSPCASSAPPTPTCATRMATFQDGLRTLVEEKDAALRAQVLRGVSETGVANWPASWCGPRWRGLRRAAATAYQHDRGPLVLCPAGLSAEPRTTASAAGPPRRRKARRRSRAPGSRPRRPRRPRARREYHDSRRQRQSQRSDQARQQLRRAGTAAGPRRCPPAEPRPRGAGRHCASDGISRLNENQPQHPARVHCGRSPPASSTPRRGGAAGGGRAGPASGLPGQAGHPAAASRRFWLTATALPEISANQGPTGTSRCSAKELTTWNAVFACHRSPAADPGCAHRYPPPYLAADQDLVGSHAARGRLRCIGFRARGPAPPSRCGPARQATARPGTRAAALLPRPARPREPAQGGRCSRPGQPTAGAGPAPPRSRPAAPARFVGRRPRLAESARAYRAAARAWSGCPAELRTSAVGRRLAQRASHRDAVAGQQPVRDPVQAATAPVDESTSVSTSPRQDRARPPTADRGPRSGTGSPMSVRNWSSSARDRRHGHASVCRTVPRRSGTRTAGAWAAAPSMSGKSRCSTGSGRRPVGPASAAPSTAAPPSPGVSSTASRAGRSRPRWPRPCSVRPASSQLGAAPRRPGRAGSTTASPGSTRRIWAKNVRSVSSQCAGLNEPADHGGVGLGRDAGLQQRRRLGGHDPTTVRAGRSRGSGRRRCGPEPVHRARRRRGSPRTARSPPSIRPAGPCSA